ncbi:glycosyltransferase [Celeribacter halophilus]|uniref:Glycosyltransferase involved in cell wall bisynthesis n=1 Tax=Celeribacter halophilus TaxID=576117 RepID=A0A1I3WH49_9RHOB|nr:glycosyltransferase [Celeribacter halophilus]PZX09854.1 glycosyltransferase involved in cell wall biosynthesis [Celeribacter halophilus]SFK06720.1 Glycosyltransferase involved in cell wall bisynthesis [Celeribacter halophilus]
MERICFYLTSFEGGGAERNTALIASELARRGHPVLIIVERDSGPNKAFLEPAVETRVLPSGYLSRMRALRKTLSDWNADVVFARLGLCPIFATLIGLTGTRWKTIISYHNPYDPDTYLGVRLTWWGIAILSRLTFATFGVSQDIVNQLKAYGAKPRRCHVIHNPVNIDWVLANKDALPEPPLPSKRPYIVSVGRLVPQKGYPDLIAAYGMIADQIKEDLVILGEGPLEAHLRKQITEAGLSNRVHLLGYAQNPFPFYANARQFILASHWEGFGNVLVESLACGTSVVSTDCPGGPKDILQSGEFGTLVPLGDIPALAAAIESGVRSPQDREKCFARAQDFKLPKIATLYVELANGTPKEVQA